MASSLRKQWNKTYAWINSAAVLKPAVHLMKEMNDRMQKRKRLAFYSRFITRGDLCFDIGANIGNRTNLFTELGCSVVAVEPQKECFVYLKKKFGSNQNVQLVHKAVSDKTGEEDLFICEADSISSMSSSWISAVKKSGRYSGFKWNKKIKVETTTLDLLIKKFGMPVLCKIDVEGSEFAVLKGLSKPIRNISFEFSQDYLPSTLKCLQYLNHLGDVRFNYSIGESMELALKEWTDIKHMETILKSFPGEAIWGDIYARYR